MPKTEPLTTRDVAFLYILLCLLIGVIAFMSERRENQTLTSLQRIEQKVNQPCR